MKVYNTLGARAQTDSQSTRSETHGTTSSNGNFTQETWGYTYQENSLSTFESISYERITNVGTNSSSSFLGGHYDNCSFLPPFAFAPSWPFPAITSLSTPGMSTCRDTAASVCFPFETDTASPNYCAFTPCPTPSTSWYSANETRASTSYLKNGVGSTSGTTLVTGLLNYTRSASIQFTCGQIAPLPVFGPPYTATSCQVFNVLNTCGWGLVIVGGTTSGSISGGGTAVAGDYVVNLITSTNSFITRTYQKFQASNITITVTRGTITGAGIGTTTTDTEAFTTFSTSKASTTINNPIGRVFTKTKDVIMAKDANGNFIQSVYNVTEFEEGLTGNDATQFFNEQAYVITGTGGATDFGYALLTNIASPTTTVSFSVATRQVNILGFGQDNVFTTKSVKNSSFTYTYNGISTNTNTFVTITNTIAYNTLPFPETSTDNTVKVFIQYKSVGQKIATVPNGFDQGPVALPPLGLINAIQNLTTTYTRLMTVEQQLFIRQSFTEFIGLDSASFLAMTTDVHNIVGAVTTASALNINYTSQTISAGSYTQMHSTNQGLSIKVIDTLSYIGAIAKLNAENPPGIHAFSLNTGALVFMPVALQGFRPALAASYTNDYYGSVSFDFQEISDTIWKQINLGGGKTTSIAANQTNFSTISFPFISKEQQTSVSVFMNYPSTVSIVENVSYNSTASFNHTLRFSFSNNKFTFTRENNPIFLNNTGGLSTNISFGKTTSKSYEGTIAFGNVVNPRTILKIEDPSPLVFGGILGAILTEKEIFAIYRNLPPGHSPSDGSHNFMAYSSTVQNLGETTTIVSAKTFGIFYPGIVGDFLFITSQGTPGVATAIEPAALVKAQENAGTRLATVPKYIYATQFNTQFGIDFV